MEREIVFDVLEKCDEYEKSNTSHMNNRERLHLREGFCDGYEQCLKDLGLDQTKVITEDDTHNNLAELVADIRNKLGAINNYTTMMEHLKDSDNENTKKHIKLMMDAQEKVVISSMVLVKDLMMQFENFSIQSIYRHK